MSAIVPPIMQSLATVVKLQAKGYMVNNLPETKETFSAKYITSSEMMNFLDISRAGFLYGRRSGKIKAEPIVINDGRLLIWERMLVQDDLLAWKAALLDRKSAA